MEAVYNCHNAANYISEDVVDVSHIEDDMWKQKLVTSV